MLSDWRCGCSMSLMDACHILHILTSDTSVSDSVPAGRAAAAGRGAVNVKVVTRERHQRRPASRRPVLTNADRKH